MTRALRVLKHHKSNATFTFMRYGFRYLVIGIAAVMFFAASSFAQSRSVVRFPKGQTQTTVRGAVRTSRYIDYIVSARIGQIISVKLDAKNPDLKFVVYDPNKEIPDGATNVRSWTASIPASGDYAIRVILPRNGSRAETSASYAVSFSLK